jgi:hypothetical protein
MLFKKIDLSRFISPTPKRTYEFHSKHLSQNSLKFKPLAQAVFCFLKLLAI